VEPPLSVCHKFTTSFCMRRDRDAEGVERDEMWRGVPSPCNWGFGERCKVHSGVLGAAPAENGFYAGSKKLPGTPFSVLSDGGPPNVAGPEKSPFSPSRL